ncbi:MAG: putative peptidoglycan glycosyltransferase FtsW [Fimbriimonadales bacterium]
MRQTKTIRGRSPTARRTTTTPAAVWLPVRTPAPANPSSVASSRALFPYPALFWLPLLLCFVGLVFQFSVCIGDILKPGSPPTSPFSAFRVVIMQSLWLVIGLGVMSLIARVPVRFWQATAGLWLVLGIVSVLILFIPGVGKTINYATRWLAVPLPGLGQMLIQPSEAYKLITVFWFAWLYSTQKRVWSLWAVLGTLLWLLGVIAIERQPDLGTGLLIMGVGVGIAFLGGARIGRLSLFLGGGALLVALVLFLPVIKGAIKGEPWEQQRNAYRLQRVIAMMDPWAHQQDVGYQMVRAQLAVGSGGFARLGIGEGREKRYLPAAENDYIFATIAEETGFVGSVMVIGLVALVVYHCFRLACQTPSRFGRLVVLGMALWIGLSALINIGMAIGVLPTVGLPLPFVSAGGSALLSLMAGLGVVQAVARERR